MSTDQRVEIAPSGDGSHHVFVDGRPVFPRSANVEFRAGELTLVTLELVVIDAPTVASPARVVIPDETVRTLVALGWTPPAAETTGAPA